MKIVFFGTSEFALPALKKMRGSGYQIVAVVTQPDKPAGRRQLPLPSPVKVWALKHRLNIYQPENLEFGIWNLQVPKAEVYIAVSYGKVIPKEIIDISKFGILNIHPSLLPKYRGPSPIQAAILNGDKETGVTIIKIDEEVDHGDIVASSKLKAQSSKITFRELHDTLATLGGQLLIETLPKYIGGEIKLIAQDHSKATYTKRIHKKTARIDWQAKADIIERQVRAFSEWPVAWTMLARKRVKIYEAEAKKDLLKDGVPGQIMSIDQVISVRCGVGILAIKTLQVEGSRKMSAQSFINGHPGLPDKIFA